jgi:hypothetical protein
MGSRTISAPVRQGLLAAKRDSLEGCGTALAWRRPDEQGARNERIEVAVSTVM